MISDEQINQTLELIAQDIHLLQSNKQQIGFTQVSADEFQMALGEARQTLGLLKGFHLEPGAKILEVGAGLGLASSALSLLGFHVTALEPGGIGFEANRALSDFYFQRFRSQVKFLSSNAEDADFSDSEIFDLVVSNNVLEHIGNFEAALTNLVKHLAPKGAMIHSCPNYLFPFEPHFGIPLFPFSPRLTRFFLPKRISNSGLWHSLNFISARQIKKVFRESDFSVLFKKGRMAKSFARLVEDPEFRGRHKVLGSIAQNKFTFKLVERLLGLPYWLATPMDFIIVHRSISGDPRVLAWLEN